MKMKKYIITKKEYETAKTAAKRNENKQIEKRLQVIIMRYEGKKDKEIAEKLGCHRKRVSQLCAEFRKKGLEEYTLRKYGGNNRNMRDEEEKRFLARFEEAAKEGQIITIGEIAAAYDEATGKTHESKSSVYYLLHKHGWRMITPKTAHPGKASDGEIESTKKTQL
jgi:transposase